LKYKILLAATAACVIGTCIGYDTTRQPIIHITNLSTDAGAPTDRTLTDPFDGRSLSGNYLASQFAQRRHDWDKAGTYLDHVLTFTPDNIQLMNKSMVLAMGSGHPEAALDMAHKIIAIEKDNALALMFLTIEAFEKKDYAGASEIVKKLPEGSLSTFIHPLLHSWAQAANGVRDAKGLYENTIHIYHAILIADYLHDMSGVEDLLQASLGAQGLSVQDLDRIADVYAHIGKKDVAIALYDKVLEQWPENRVIAQKLEKLKAGESVTAFTSITTPAQGVALALYDMALLLYQEYSDESARVFAHMALHLDPAMTDASLLLAHVAARHDRTDEAIALYRSLPPESVQYSEARRLAVELLENAGRTDEALSELNAMVSQSDDVEALIQIGDIYRREEKFDKAIDTYNKAAKLLGSEIPKEYWQLYYVRGMSYERLGEWEKAETDLKTALKFQPEQPMVLNYLGYAWADQGVNLKESLELIRKAVALEPEDGYITDSLGWVLYRMGEHKESVPHLERAVELLPYDPVINDHLGDAYWRVGRKLEAKFQWQRARNHSEDKTLISTIDLKLDQGLADNEAGLPIVKEARTITGEDGDILQP
jgi:tetratricopeptide (TPR) repeat protein